MEIVMGYYRNDHNFELADAHFIKRLARFSNKMIQLHSPVFEYAQKIHSLNIEGLKRVDMGQLSEEKTDLLKMDFLTYAGTAARVLSDHGKKIDWSREWYRCHDEASNIADTLDVKNASFVHKSAANAAAVLYHLEQDKQQKIKFAENWYTHRRRNAELTTTEDKAVLGRVYFSAGDAAQQMFLLTNDIVWARNWYECMTMASEQIKDVDKDMYAKILGSRAISSHSLFERNHDFDCLKTAILCYNQFLRHYKKTPDLDAGKKITWANKKIKELMQIANSI